MRFLGSLAVSLSLLAASSANALSISPNPVRIEGPEVTGELRLIGFVSGLPSGATLLYGAVQPTDVTFVFEFAVDAGSDFGTNFGLVESRVPGGPWTAAGFIPGSGAAPFGIFNFGTGLSFSLGLQPGADSTALFVAAPSLAIGATFGVSLGNSAALAPIVPVTIVPEPSILLLLATGVLALGRSGRQPRR
jgi:hypothetical protein